MRFACTNYLIIQYNEWLAKETANPSLPFLIHRNAYFDFQKANDNVFRTVTEKHQAIVAEHYELDENGRVKHEGETPLLKEGKTSEMFQAAMDEFAHEPCEINLKPKVFTKFPVIIA